MLKVVLHYKQKNVELCVSPCQGSTIYGGLTRLVKQKKTISCSPSAEKQCKAAKLEQLKFSGKIVAISGT